MNKYVSDKIRVISFFSMLLVLWIHAYNSAEKSLDGTIVVNKVYSTFIQDFISHGICRIAVPMFFIISGYLFFLKTEPTASGFLINYKKRIHTLVIPYLLWSLWGIMFYYILQIPSQFQSFFSNNMIRDYSMNQLLFTFFIQPIPYQLWFLRDLIILVLFSPILYWLIKFFKLITILFFASLWLFDVNYILFSNQAVLFFAVGAFISIHKKDFLSIHFSNTSWIFFVLWISLVSFKTLLLYNGFNNILFLNIIQKISIISGIIAIWCIYDLLVKTKDVSIYRFYSLTSFSFFLYAFHEPILTLFKKTLFYLMDKSSISSIAIYILAPLLTLLISITIGRYLKQMMPKFYEIITGGR